MEDGKNMSANQAWVFYGSVPEEGDVCLVWADSEPEAIAQGRKSMGYENEEDYDDSDFRVATPTIRSLLDFGVNTETDALRDVLLERQRHHVKWGDSHDDSEEKAGELAKAAGALALDFVGDAVDFWGYRLVKKYRNDRRKRLVVAASLLLAEVERMDRGSQ